MDFTTDLQIRKWKPNSNNEIKRVGKGLYIRGFLSGRKLFQIRFKQKWIDLDDYGSKTLAAAQELSLASLRKLKANDVSIDQLKASLSRSSSTDDFSEEWATTERNSSVCNWHSHIRRDVSPVVQATA